MNEYKKSVPYAKSLGAESELEHLLAIIIFYCENGDRGDKCMEHIIHCTRRVWDLVPDNQPIVANISQEELEKLDLEKVQRADKLIYRETVTNCNRLISHLEFEGFVIEERLGDPPDKIWFTRTDGEGMQLDKKQLKDALEKLFKEWM